MNARYQTGTLGRFISQDPVFWAVGDEGKLKDKTGLTLSQYLENPQSFNSYSYAANNPLKFVDQSGEFIGEPGRAIASDQRQIASFLNQAADYTSSQGGFINHVSGFVTHAVADTVSNVANVFDPDQRAGIRILGLGLTALDVSSGGEGKAAAQFVKQFGRSLGIDIAKQAKHVLGPAYKQGRSIITHSDPQKLINEFAGTGYRIFNQGKLQKEVINFGQVIGKNIDPKTGQVLDTTRGTIHYGKSGTHLVPTFPK